MRIYDPRVGRFLSTDPLAKSYPELTPYQFASNRPIDGIDMDGLEYVGTKQVDGNPPIFVQTVFAINDFLANTVSSGMGLVSPSTQGGVIRNILRNNGIVGNIDSSDMQSHGFGILNCEMPQTAYTRNCHPFS